MDIVGISEGINVAALLFGYGNGTFTDDRIYNSGHYSREMDVADFTNDNHTNVVAIHHTNSSITVFLGDGNDNFAGKGTRSCFGKFGRSFLRF